jgi:hypothetical protein
MAGWLDRRVELVRCDLGSLEFYRGQLVVEHELATEVASNMHEL